VNPDLSKFTAGRFERGASWPKEALWQLASGVMVATWVPGSAIRIALLRLFGARIGHGVVIKPRVRVKFPWRLVVGDHSWIGESAWIDNLAEVTIGTNVCISQGVYLCTGSHRWDREAFDLECKPIVVGDGAWLAAFSRVAPGVTIGPNAVISLGAVAVADVRGNVVLQGNPAKEVRDRVIGADRA
jgi:putative colanic acid biosynthesis acetyltransferase WcaF